MLPETGAENEKERFRADKMWFLRIEFKAFINAMMAIPCQIVHQARGLIYRVLAYNPHQRIFFRLLEALHC